MPHQRGIVRAACTARNAYNPALAITSAFLPSNNDALRFSIRSTAAHCVNGGSSIAGPRHFSSSQHVQEVRRGSRKTEHGGEGTLQRQPPKKGTYAGYDALMDSFSSDASQNSNADPAKLAQNAMSAVHQSRSVRDDTRREATSGGSTRKSDIQVIRSTELDKGKGGRGQREKKGDIATVRSGTVAGDGRFAGSARKTASVVRYPYAKDRRERSSARSDPDSPQASENTELAAADGWKAQMHWLGEQANRLAQQKPKMSPAGFESMRKRMNYPAISIPLEQSTTDDSMPYPWVAKSGGASVDPGMETLNQEIRRFAEYMQPTAAETAAREAVADQVHALIQEHCWGDVRSSLFGSETTGLSTATSDLDFRLFQPDAEERNGGKFPPEQHRRLAVQMREHPDWIAVVLRNARFPIINAQHRHTGIDVQIVSSPSTQAQHVTTLQCLETIPNLRELYFVLRALLGLRGLADVFNGGTGSYGLLIMLVAALTRRGNAFTAPTVDPGAQLLQFFDFYTAHYRPTFGIAVLPPTDPALPPTTKLFRKHTNHAIDRAAYIRAAYARADPVRAGQWSIGYRRPYQPYLLCLQDPANPLNDLGRKTNAIKHVVATLGAVREGVRGKVEAAKRGELGEGGSVLESAVGRCHEVLAGWRRRVEEYGVLELERRRERERVEVKSRTDGGDVAVGRESEVEWQERPRVVETSTLR